MTAWKNALTRANLLLLAGSLLFTGVLLELGARIYLATLPVGAKVLFATQRELIEAADSDDATLVLMNPSAATV